MRGAKIGSQLQIRIFREHAPNFDTHTEEAQCWGIGSDAAGVSLAGEPDRMSLGVVALLGA
jgi:hypothetical protein